MALRYMPAEAGPVVKQAQNKASELETQFNRLFSSVGYLGSDSNKVLYRPLFFSKNFSQQELIWSVYKQCSFGKTHRSFGDFHQLYMIQMNGLNFARALTGPGVHYKDGKLGRTYIHRILDTSNEMLAELVELKGKARKLKNDLLKLPSSFDTEWEKRYHHMHNLADGLLNDLDQCTSLVTERGDLGEQILAIWFPEEVEDEPQPVARPVHTPSFARAQAQAHASQEDPVTEDGTKQNPYVLTPGIYDVAEMLDTSKRSQPTYFKVNVLDAGIGKTYRVNFSTTPKLDWDTHVRARQGDRVIFSRQETYDTTPHYLSLTPTNKTDNIEIEIQYWERTKKHQKAQLEVKIEQWEDGGL